MKPADITELDEVAIYHASRQRRLRRRRVLGEEAGAEADNDGDTDMITVPAATGSPQGVSGRRKLAPMRRRRQVASHADQMSINGG